MVIGFKRRPDSPAFADDGRIADCSFTGRVERGQKTPAP
jgi:hypothetical protein